MKKTRYDNAIFFFFVVMFSPFSASATDTLVLSDLGLTQSASPYAYLLEDPTHSLSLQQVISPEYHQQFRLNQQALPNFGRSTSVYWLRFSLKNQSHLKWYLLIDSLLGEDLDLYILPHNPELDETTALLIALSGSFAQRITAHRRALWSLNLPPNAQFSVYVRASNAGQAFKLPIELLPADTLLTDTMDEYRLFSFLYAAMLTLALYNLFLFFSFREISYLSLVGIILSTAATLHVSYPVFDSLRFLAETDRYFYILPLLMAIIFFSLFSKQVLHTQQKAPKLELIYRSYIGIAIGLIPIAGFISALIVIPLAMILSLVLLTLFASSFLMIKQRDPIAKNLFLSALVIVLGVVPELVSSLFNLPFLSDSYQGSTLMGVVASLILMSFVQTERTRLLRQKMEQTVAISEAKDSFFALMNHELRTPLNTVLGVSTLLKLSKMNKKQQDYLEKLELSARHLLGLINDILDTAKIKNKHFQLTPQPFQLKNVMSKVQTLLEEQANQKGLKLVIDSQQKALLQVWLRGDPTRLSQILINLLSNAIKFTEHGEVTLHIEQQQTTADSQTLLFIISDTGIGIPKPQQATLFDAFIQAEQGAASLHQGTGLGLSISKGLVEVMGGKLEFESVLNEGTRFFFTLSFTLETKTKPVDITPTTPNPSTLSALILPKDLTILLVDDNEMNRFIGREMIQTMQGNVTLAPNGKSSLVQLQQNHFDVVLMDISMPDMDGFDVTRWIRTQGQYANIKIIALTAHATETIRQECKAAGMDGYLAKPFEYKALYDAICGEKSFF